MTGLVIEAALLGVVKLTPAVGVIMRPVYLLVAVMVAVGIWRSARRRTNRRHGEERRHDLPPG